MFCFRICSVLFLFHVITFYIINRKLILLPIENSKQKYGNFPEFFRFFSEIISHLNNNGPVDCFQWMVQSLKTLTANGPNRLVTRMLTSIRSIVLKK
ncbi:hypothetical protein DERP_008025 [Dermatophagoides pteronyssinus]|uniref:Secreted protein n=1 Tax=Dermatophagoides pteronyssinus TaxID=6956 RepID=A0ABQ8ITL7_DERPT|nr:hypothetical protein DERP_008025 [Dermatophagoides pteronyssinus]